MLKSFPVKTDQIWRSAVLALLAGLVGYSNDSQLRAATIAQSNTNKPKVVATSTVVCNVAKQIAQDTVDLKCLIDPGSDPHEYHKGVNFPPNPSTIVWVLAISIF